MGQIASSVSSGMKKTMDENFKRQMDFQIENFQLQLERQLVLQNEIRERQISMQIARSREIVSKYYGPFYSIVLGGGLLGDVEAVIFQTLPLPHLSLPLTKNIKTRVECRTVLFNLLSSQNPESTFAFVMEPPLKKIFMRKRNPAFLFPAIPLGFVLAFQYDMAYGTLMQRSRAEAEVIMKEERERIALPHGLPTFEAIETKRLAAKQNK